MSETTEMTETTGEFVRVCSVDDLPEVGAVAADVDGTLVAIVRDSAGDIHAIDGFQHAGAEHALPHREVFGETAALEQGARSGQLAISAGAGACR